MPWSTRELAELAGTTVKAVRHYHQVGLLDEPERAANGYKLYDVSHLVRVLRIKRLGDLGVPLAQIATMGDADREPEQALREIDAELAATIARLQRVRGELAAIIHHRAQVDLPPGFAEVSADLSDADRSMLLIYSRVFTATAMADLREMVQDSHRTEADDEFDALTDEADDAQRQSIAERLAPVVAGMTETYPWLGTPGEQSLHGAAATGAVVGEAIAGLYNPAQLDVLGRMYALLQRHPTA